MIRKLVAHLIVNAVALGCAFFVLMAVDPSFNFQLGIWSTLLLLVIITAVNIFIKPLIGLVSVPFVFITMGLFRFVVNAVALFVSEYIFNYVLMIEEVHSYTGDASLAFSGFWDYLIAGVVIGVVNMVLNWIFKIK